MKENLNRRDFIKSVGAGGVYLVVKSMAPMGSIEKVLKVEQVSETQSSGKKWGMVIDVGACIGCRECVYACKAENNIPNSPKPMQWIEIFEMDQKDPITRVFSVPPTNSKTDYTDSPKEGKWYLPAQCVHCEDPPCVKLCPTGATFIGEGGIVEMDYDKCIGCRQCMAACPYNARSFNWGAPEIPAEDINPLVPVRPVGVVEKCTFCIHRVREGRLPACVEACPVGARHFGDLNDPNSSVSKLLDKYISTTTLEEMSTHPKLFYISSGNKWLEEG